MKGKKRKAAQAKEKERLAAQKEKEVAALREKEREKALIKEKVIQKKRLEEWELEKKGKKRKAPEEIKIDEVFSQQHLTMPLPKTSPQKVSKTENSKGKDKKQPISWLQFLESQRK